MTDVALSQDVSRFLRYLGVERQLSPITLLNAAVSWARRCV